MPFIGFIFVPNRFIAPYLWNTSSIKTHVLVTPLKTDNLNPYKLLKARLSPYKHQTMVEP